MYQESIFLVLLDLIKAYDNLDNVRILKILEEYGAVPKMRGILAELWARQEVVTLQNGYRVPYYRATRRYTQHDLTPPTLFNMVVDNVVRYWLSMTVKFDAVIHGRLVHVVGRRI